MMRPCASQDASAEPTPTATENTARKAVTVLSSPPITVLTTGGRSEATVTASAQNQLETIQVHHNRASAFKTRSSAKVERAILASTLTSCAVSPVEGICRAA